MGFESNSDLVVRHNIVKKAVERELRRWREKEQKKATKIASRIMAEFEATQPEQIKYSPIYHKVQMRKPELSMMSKTVEKQRSSVSKKTMMPSFSGTFQRTKSQVDDGLSSYLPNSCARYLPNTGACKPTCC